MLGLVAWPVHAQFADAPRARPPDNPFDQATANASQDHWAPQLLQGAKRAADRAPIPETDASLGVLQTDSLVAWPRLYRGGDLLVTGSLTGTAAGFKMWNNDFGAAAVAADARLRDESRLGRILSRARPEGDVQGQRAGERLRWDFVHGDRDPRTRQRR